jgi:hypothetical protein
MNDLDKLCLTCPLSECSFESPACPIQIALAKPNSTAIENWQIENNVLEIPSSEVQTAIQSGLIVIVQERAAKFRYNVRDFRPDNQYRTIFGWHTVGLKTRFFSALNSSAAMCFIHQGFDFAKGRPKGFGFAKGRASR